MASPTYDPFDPVGSFFPQVPDDILKDFCRAIGVAYQESLQYCYDNNYPSEQIHDLLPQLRRLTADRNILHIAGRHSGIIVRSEWNAGKNCFHVRVHCHRVVLTFSSARYPGEFVREAIFREQYARSCQLQLFHPEYPPVVEGDLYGILLHGADRRRPGYPAFLQVAFPDPDLKTYLDEPIDLLRRFPDVKQLLSPNASAREEIRRPEMPKLRDIPKSEESS
jgi:hypothetical protein